MRRSLPLALVMTSVVALTACNGSEKPTSPGGSPTATGVASSSLLDPGAKGPAAPVPDARQGGNLVVRAANAPSTLDPTRQYYVDSQAILKLTSRTLTTYAMRDGRAVLVPDLATDLGRVSPDGLTWTFTLKEGLTYEDGSPVRAADVAYAVKRSFAQDELPGGPTYQIDHLRGGQDYKGPFQRATGTPFDGVEAKGDRDVVLHLSEPWSSVPYFASFTLFSPIPQAKDTRDRYGDHPLATGPYKFRSYAAGSRLVLERNSQWRPDSDPARHAYADTLTFEWGGDAGKAQSDILDQVPTSTSTLSYDAVTKELEGRASAAKGQLVEGTSPCMAFITLDTRQIPLEVRRAIAVAYPWQSEAKAIQLDAFNLTPRRSYSPPQLAGAQDQDVKDVPVTGDGDPARAREMLQAAGQLGFALSWYVAEDLPSSRAASTVRANALRAAGFTVRTTDVPREKLQELRGSLEAPVNMLQGPSGWCYDWPNGDAIYPPMFSSTSRRDGMNVGALADPELDARMKAIAAKPLDQQGPEWAALDKDLIAGKLPALPSGNERSTFVFGTGVGGVVNDPNLGLPDFSGIYLRG